MKKTIYGRFGGGGNSPQYKRTFVELTMDQLWELSRRGPGKRGVFKATDGKKYAVYGASCSLPRCYCAVRFKEVK